MMSDGPKGKIVRKLGGWKQHGKSTQWPYDIVVRWKKHEETTEWHNDTVWSWHFHWSMCVYNCHSEF